MTKIGNNTTCFDYAVSYVMRYPKSVRDMRKKLFDKGFCEQDIDYAIQMLQKYGYLNDKVYAKLYVRSEVLHKGKPPFLIRQKLFQKGIDKNTISCVFEELKDEIEERMISAINNHIARMLRRGKSGTYIIQYLCRKGYEYSLVRDLVDEACDK